MRREKKNSAFKTGAIALAFLIIGYQVALFVHQASVEAIVAQERPSAAASAPADTLPAAAAGSPAAGAAASPLRRARSEEVREEIVRKYTPRSVESFPFDPNTVSQEYLQRLGFSEKQAASIINYREKGGRFHRASDFAKSFVVADSVFKRLEPFITIPLVDINAADSTAFDNLPGIGPYYAAKMVEYRDSLQGYSYPEQLLDLWNFGQERLDGLLDLIETGPCTPYPLWTLPEEELKKHPYIDSHAAHSIVLFRDNTPAEQLSVENLIKAGILDPEKGGKLAKCRIANVLWE